MVYIGRLGGFVAGLGLVFALAGRLSAADDLVRAEEQAFKAATAFAEPSVVRIETVGGLDLVGELLTGHGPTTGVAVSADGYIITSSFNFASRPAGIVVTLGDGRRFPASIIASDRSRMLTLLKIDLPREGRQLTPLDAAPREKVRVGEWAIALGRVYDPALPNVSVGIISAVNRVWGRAFQTDAKVSPTNYGGPLIDIEGRGIGILVPLSPQKTDETAGVEWYDGGIGFAIPLEDVYASLDRLKEGQDLRPGLLGVAFPEQGVLGGAPRIDRVRPESPADKAGLLVGDVVIEADGQSVDRIPDLKHILGRRYAGDRLALKVQRGDETLQVELELTAELVPYESGYLGILPVRPGNSETLTGVAIREVLSESPAEAAGLSRRDVIIECGGRPVADETALTDLIGRHRPGETVTIRYRRGEQETSTEVTLTALPDEVPQELPTATIPAPGEGTVDEELTGRSTATLAGTERSYWRYVPTHYNPAYSYGLVVWMHPAGDTMEAAMLRLWQQHCDRRGLILVGLKAADLTGWTPGEAETVRQVVEEMQTRYAIDSRRICIHGHAEGGRFAWSVAFKHRELFRAVMASSAPLREPPPDNNPEFRTQLTLVSGEEDPLRPRIEQSVKVLESMKYPTRLIVVPGEREQYPGEETVDELVRWLDVLDRI